MIENNCTIEVCLTPDIKPRQAYFELIRAFYRVYLSTKAELELNKIILYHEIAEIYLGSHIHAVIHTLRRFWRHFGYFVKELSDEFWICILWITTSILLLIQPNFVMLLIWFLAFPIPLLSYLVRIISLKDVLNHMEETYQSMCKWLEEQYNNEKS